MTSHELAKKLLELPDCKIYIPLEYISDKVTKNSEVTRVFFGTGDNIPNNKKITLKNMKKYEVKAILLDSAESPSDYTNTTII
jgi:hypothetical protein